MDERAVLHRRVQGWKRLSQLTDRAETSFRKLSGPETLEFIRLYRRASADLALIVAQSSTFEVVEHLNAIVARAYGVLYRRPARPLAECLVHGARQGARVARKNAWAFLLALSVFCSGALFSFALMRARPDLREHFVSEAMEPLFDKWKEGAHDRREGGESVAMTAFYASNNPRAGVLLNSLAIATFGVGSAAILWMNGSLLGSLAADMASVGKLGFLLTSVAPHGVSEVGGFLLTGAGGFVLAKGLVRPGRRSRGQALRASGKDALVMLLTGLVMICVAAPIEGFFSFNPLVPAPAKLAFAVLALAAWMSYFLGYGREEPAPGAT